MRMMRFIVLIVLGASVLMSYGCASYRFASSIHKQTVTPGSLHNLKLNIVSVKYIPTDISTPLFGFMKKVEASEFMAIAEERYPGIFLNSPDALPVEVRITGSAESQIIPALTAIATVGIFGGVFPAYGANKYSVTVKTTFYDLVFQVICRREAFFVRTDAVWITVFTPLGLIPVPGKSDTPKFTLMDGRTTIWAAQQTLNLTSIVDAIVQSSLPCSRKLSL